MLRFFSALIFAAISYGNCFAQLDSAKKELKVFVMKDEYIQKGKVGPFTLIVERTTIVHTQINVEQLRIDYGVTSGVIDLDNLPLVISEMRFVKSQVDSSLNGNSPHMKLHAGPFVTFGVKWNKSEGKWEYYVYLGTAKVDITDTIYLGLLNAFVEIQNAENTK